MAAAEETERLRLLVQIQELKALRDTLEEKASNSIGGLCLDILAELVDEQALGVAFEFHRTTRLGLLCPCTPETPTHESVA